MEDDIKTVLDGLSRLIIARLKGVARQQYFPDSDPDNMDNVIAKGKADAAKLRKLREDFEEIVTGALNV